MKRFYELIVDLEAAAAHISLLDRYHFYQMTEKRGVRMHDLFFWIRVFIQLSTTRNIKHLVIVSLFIFRFFFSVPFRALRLCAYERIVYTGTHTCGLNVGIIIIFTQLFKLHRVIPHSSLLMRFWLWNPTSDDEKTTQRNIKLKMCTEHQPTNSIE